MCSAGLPAAEPAFRSSIPPTPSSHRVARRRGTFVLGFYQNHSRIIVQPRPIGKRPYICEDALRGSVALTKVFFKPRRAVLVLFRICSLGNAVAVEQQP